MKTKYCPGCKIDHPTTEFGLVRTRFDGMSRCCRRYNAAAEARRRDARNLYGVENPRPSWLLKEAARVVRPLGRIGLLHVAVPFPPKGCRLVNVYGITTGVGYRIRAFTLFEKAQDGLFD